MKLSFNSDFCFENIISLSQKDFPQTQKFNWPFSKNLFSSYKVELPKEIDLKIKAFNKEFYKLYLYNLSLRTEDIFQFESFPKSKFHKIVEPNILSCLDFHISSEGHIRLIEANTNASGYLMAYLIYLAHNLEFDPQFKNLKSMFSDSGLLKSSLFYIFDEAPETQNMFLEFLMYEDLLNTWSVKSQIMDSQRLTSSIESEWKEKGPISIYNRSTDFYLRKYPQVFHLWWEDKIKMSPHPIAFDLWAHKRNLGNHLELSKDHVPHINLPQIQSFLLPSRLIQNRFPTKEEAWAQRKSLFFKPTDSFGGKATYKGLSVSKKYFDEIWSKNYLAQDYFPAPKVQANDQEFWKFDLRVFVYKEECLGSVARVYQGQVTNFKSPKGGFAPVVYTHKQ